MGPNLEHSLDSLRRHLDQKGLRPDDLAGQWAARENHLNLEGVELVRTWHSNRVRAEPASVEAGVAAIEGDTPRLGQLDLSHHLAAVLGKLRPYLAPR